MTGRSGVSHVSRVRTLALLGLMMSAVASPGDTSAPRASSATSELPPLPGFYLEAENHNAVRPSGERPNVLVIMVDDMRWDAFSAAGHPFVKTPNIDRIRNEGAHLRNAFVTTSLCSPSRASFLTGCYAHNHGVVRNDDTDFNSTRTPSFAQYLKAAGYRTGYVGKWHMRRDDSRRPGFDDWVSFVGQGRYLNPEINDNGNHFTAEGEYITDLLSDYAVDFLESNNPGETGRPFLLFLSHKAAHALFVPPVRHRRLWRRVDAPMPVSYEDDLSGKPAWQRMDFVDNTVTSSTYPGAAAEKRTFEPWDPTDFWYDYYRTIKAVDEGVGLVLAKLEEMGELDNTFIVFTADNGLIKGEHGLGYRKRIAYEESIRVPLLVRYPPVVKAGSTVNRLALNIDLAPTILDLAGLPIPTNMDGRSWRPLFIERYPDWRENFLYEYWVELNIRTPRLVGVRTQDGYKLVKSPDTGDIDELYDLNVDPHEVTNFVGDPNYRDVRLRLENDLAERMSETGYRAFVPSPTDDRSAVPRGLVLDYDFSGGEVMDHAGGDNNGFPTGNVAIVSGRSGRRAADFSGGYITAEPTRAMDSSGHTTIELWVHPDSGDGVLAAHGDSLRGYALALRDGNPIFILREDNVQPLVSIADSCEVDVVGRWVHLVAVINAGRVELYVDGQYVDGVYSPNLWTAPVDGLSLGGDADSQVHSAFAGGSFEGKMERVRMFKGALSRSRIEDLYRESLP